MVWRAGLSQNGQRQLGSDLGGQCQLAERASRHGLWERSESLASPRTISRISLLDRGAVSSALSFLEASQMFRLILAVVPGRADRMTSRLLNTIAYTIGLFIPILNLYVLYKALTDDNTPRWQKVTSVVLWLVGVGLIGTQVPALAALGLVSLVVAYALMIRMIWLEQLPRPTAAAASREAARKRRDDELDRLAGLS
jgi:hypothetical protein